MYHSSRLKDIIVLKTVLGIKLPAELECEEHLLVWICHYSECRYLSEM